MEFKYNGIIFDRNNVLDYIKENGKSSEVLSVAEAQLTRDEFIKLLIDCLRLNLISTDYFMLRDYFLDEVIVRQILLSNIKQLIDSKETNKEDVFRNQLAYLVDIESKSEVSEEQKEKFNNFINYIYLSFGSERRPDITRVVDDKVIGVSGIIDWALEKSGYSFSKNKNNNPKR